MKTHILLPMLASLVLLLGGCRSGGNEPLLTLRVPVEICTADMPADRFAPERTARRIGDPGYDDELPSPRYLYLWIRVRKITGDYTVVFREIECTDGDWEYLLGEGGTEDRDSRYRYTGDVTCEFRGLTKDDVDGRVYAMASNVPFTGSELSAMKTPDELRAYTPDLGAWTAEQLRDLYSTPLGDTDNGTLYLDAENNLVFHTVSLYHCAAKADFTWEVEAALQASTWVNTITLNSLPTTCRIFEPTDNTNGLGTATLTPDMANRWIGREYTYVLQPARPGTLNYTVNFGGSAAHPNKEASFTPASLNTVFTGWYRIIADIRNN